jgi:hypothetical protein
MDGMVKSNNDENQALVALTTRGRRGSLDRIGPLGRRNSLKISPQSRWNKYLSKIICFECHDFGHYASQFPLWRGRGRKQHASIIEVDDVTNKFHREILLVSRISGTVSRRETWLMDNEESCHMKGARELFDTITKTGSDLCMELGIGSKHSV